ncbi:hypothetical protein L3Y34_008936 [Caenorhabditis briggsae]|uniref:histone acetyltransferase n=1 Tax=Caenorhabditis briggsae TaxID=6238 RepID=A0AAE9D1U6_CAEBR|nr:hypothetical protein L3Y34_008936 [Caenorhabditis briggsae]
MVHPIKNIKVEMKIEPEDDYSYEEKEEERRKKNLEDLRACQLNMKRVGGVTDRHLLDLTKEKTSRVQNQAYLEMMSQREGYGRDQGTSHEAPDVPFGNAPLSRSSFPVVATHSGPIMSSDTRTRGRIKVEIKQEIDDIQDYLVSSTTQTPKPKAQKSKATAPKATPKNQKKKKKKEAEEEDAYRPPHAWKNNTRYLYFAPAPARRSARLIKKEEDAIQKKLQGMKKEIVAQDLYPNLDVIPSPPDFIPSPQSNELHEDLASAAINKQIDMFVATGEAMDPEDLNEIFAGSMSVSTTDHSKPQSKREEHKNRDFNPATQQNTLPQDNRSEGDQQDQIMSTSSKRRNTNNSRCASLLQADPSTSAAANTEDLDSDDDEMSSAGDPSEQAKRPRTPRGRYSPDASQKRAHSRMSALSIETSRNTDLNADGSGPSSSSALSCALSTPDPDRLSSHKRRNAPPSSARSRKRRSPSVPMSQEEQSELDSDDEQDQSEMESLAIVTDDPTYKITPEHKSRFKEIKNNVSLDYEFNKGELAELYRSTKAEQARLPEQIQFGNVIMKTWYGSPFPAEFINVKLLYICEFCFFFARSDQIMQNHAKKCTFRAPPGVEIYRKEDISVFEVDGRIQKAYCQTLCLISRMFLESKTVFYDTEPFFFYIVTINDEVGCRFAGYFSKEKYEPDVNNLSCIMTLPRYQEKGLGRFLIDVSYALSRKEGWNGGPEQPLSDLGKKAYGGYWKTAIACSLVKFKDDIEFGDGISCGDIANDTGIHPHDVMLVVCGMQWGKLMTPEGSKVSFIEWNIDWKDVHAIDEMKKKGHAMKIQFDEDYLDWVPRKMHPSMDGFHELSKEEIAEDEERRKSLQKTPTVDDSMDTATPTSLCMPTSSVKKELRSRGHNRNTIGRNLQLELRNNIKVPEGKEVTDDETKEDCMRKKKKKSFSRCEDNASAIEKRRDDSPDEDEQPGPSSKPVARRHRGIRDFLEPAPSTSERKSGSSSGGHRKRTGDVKIDDSEDPTDDPVSSDDDDDRPFGAVVASQKLKNGMARMAKKVSKKKKSVSGKKFPPNFGARQEKKEPSDKPEIPGPSEGEDVLMEQDKEKQEKVKKSEDETTKDLNGEKLEDVGMATASEAEELHDDFHLNHMEEELPKNYDIGTPESYHSTVSSRANTPQPQIMTQQVHFSVDESQFEDNDAAPPLLVSEVNNLSVSESAEPLDDGPSDAPPLVQSSSIPGGYSSEDDDAPPRLSPQYGKTDEEEMIPEPSTVEIEAPAAPVQRQQSQHNGMHVDEPYRDPMSAGPSSSIQMTPQMMANGQPNMINTTPQLQHYSTPTSQQQTTPGSGGIPSCGPVYSHSTPEQQQQFMSPQMAGMPASVSSVHSVHNSNSMEMVGGPPSLQHTPQQQYDMGNSMGQMQPENGVMVNGMSQNMNSNMDQQNQMMMQQQQQHGFNSPTRPAVVPQQPQQPPQQQQQPQQIPQQPPVPVPPAPAVTNGRRRSESGANAAGARKSRQRSTAAAAPTVPPVVPAAQMPYNPMQMMQHMPVHGYFPYGYHAYPQMPENGFGYGYANAYGYPPVFNPMPQMDPAVYQQRWQQMAAFNQGQVPADQNGAAAAAAAANYQFPPSAAGQMPYFQNNTR